MSAIAATSRTCKTMADGTLRLTVDIEPNSAQAAFQMFGMPDMPIALARLTQDAAIQSAQAETISATKPKGGELARLAGQWCSKWHEGFYEFIRPIYDIKLGGDGRGWGDILPGDVGGNEEYCRHAILVICEIQSRAELDNNERAAAIFHEQIRKPFAAWRAA